MSEAEREALIANNKAHAAEAINPQWDQGFLGRMAVPDWSSLATMSQADLDPAGTGGAEVRTWIAALFAGDQPLTTVIYEPVTEWITGMGIAASAELLAT